MAIPSDGDALFARLRLWERELVDYARVKHSGAICNSKMKAAPRLTPASLKSGSSSSKSDARISSSATTSSSRGYRAATLSSFAKTSRPMVSVEYKSNQQYSPPTKDKYTKSSSPVMRKSIFAQSDFESAEESPSQVCQELCQVSSRLSGLVRDIHDERLRSAVSRFCDDIGGYVSQEERRRDADVVASASEFMSNSSLHRHVEKLVENAVAPLQRENRELGWKVTRLEEDLRQTEQSESSQSRLVTELQSCVDQLKAENVRLSDEKAAGWKEVERELARLKDDNRKIKEKMQAVVESNRVLQETLKKRDNDLRELQSNTRSLIGTLMTCLDNIPPSSPPVPSNACSSASALTMTGSAPESVVKVDSGESNSLRIRVVKQSAAKEASCGSITSVPKSKTKRAPSVKQSSTSIGVASTVTNGTRASSVGGMEADAESESDTELASTDSEFASEFHNNLQQLDDYLRQLRGSLEKKTG